jgi:hypothetical protein
VFQSLDALPPGHTVPTGREKPWGTGHAVWCAREAIHEPFAVINADDFYGADSFHQLGLFLTQPVTPAQNFDPMSGHRPPKPGAAQFAMVGFALSNTLSENGAVSRGICVADSTGHLHSITEQTGIMGDDVGEGKKYSGTAIASMNCWGFTPALFTGLDRQFDEFLTANDTAVKSEFYLPAAVSTMIAQQEAVVKLLPTSSAWFGITYREDKARAINAIADLIGTGVYPPKLF